MRRFYAFLLALLVAGPVFAQASTEQVQPELAVAGSAAITATINNFIGPDDIPSTYFPQDTSATLYIGPSLFTANNDGTTGIGVVYSVPGVTAQAVVAVTASGAPAIGCVDASVNSASDIANTFSGKIIMIRRGTCSFVYKVRNAIAGGAVGVIIYNGDDREGAADAVPGGMAATAEYVDQITIPAMLVPNGIGQPIVDELSSGGTVTLTMRAYTGGTAAEPGTSTTRSGLEVVGANPFRASTALRLTSQTAEAVRVDVFNVRGQLVATLFDGTTVGERTLRLSSADLAPGVYFVRATGESFRTQVQLTVVR